MLKLFPIEKKISIKNGDKCIVTHFEDLNSIYILKYESFPELAEISQILSKYFSAFNFQCFLFLGTNVKICANI